MHSKESTKSFEYTSGERQVATKFDEIRADHSMRYKMVPILVPEFINHKVENALDVFCGNGYGAWFLGKELKCSVTAIDGSSEAINVANTHYSLPNTFFSAKIFPFSLPSNTYDVITCYESIEHIDGVEDFFAQLASALKPGGLLFLSTPNEEFLPYEMNKHFFVHHTKHFTHQELSDLGVKNNLDLVILCGQEVYHVNEHRQAIRVNLELPMNPEIDAANPQFFIHVFQKPEINKLNSVNNVKSENGGTDEYFKGVIKPHLLESNPLMIDVGCGELGPPDGFIGVDIRPVHPKIAILSDTWSLEEFLAENSVQEFFTRHTLEHITFPQLDKTLASWLRLLKPGGRVRIMVPDLAYHILQFLDPNFQSPSPANSEWTQRQHALAGFWGWQREADTKLWDVHKSGNTFETFRDRLDQLGFVNIKRLENMPWHLDLEAFKPIKA